MFRLIVSDLRAKAAWCYEDERARSLVKVLLTDGTFAMVFYRIMQWARRYRLAPVELLMNRLNTICCNCIIGRGAEFGPGFVLIHATGVVINGQVSGGENVFIEHQVTIGAERRQSPRIGSHVFIGAGAKIIGSITLGDHSRVGANAVVLDDVPAYATVAGIPAKVVRRRAAADFVEAAG
jgi:serine O-acetyltransferase